MSMVAGVGADAVVEESIQEARAVLASIISQIMIFFRRLLEYVLSIARRFFEWSAENPLASTLMIVNFTIWSAVG